MFYKHDDRISYAQMVRVNLQSKTLSEVIPWNRRPCGSLTWAEEQRPDTGPSCGEGTGGGGAGCFHTPR